MHDASMRLHLAAGLLMATELLESGWSTEDEPGFICRSGQIHEPIAIETWYALKALHAGCLIAESRQHAAAEPESGDRPDLRR